MPASTLAHVLLRLFSLFYVLRSLMQIVTYVVIYDHGLTGLDFLSLLYQSLLPVLPGLVVGILIWILAPALSRLLVGKTDQDYTLKGITERQLLSTTFIGLGLYFILDSFANVFNWIHFFAIYQSPDYGFHFEDQPSYYELSEGVLTILVGFALIFTARNWAQKLTKTQEPPTIT